MKIALVAGAALSLAACQSVSAADGYEITGQLRNAPAGTTLHLAELMANNQPVERATATTDAEGRFTFKAAAPAAPGVYQLRLDGPNQVLLLLDNRTHLTLAGDAKSLPATYTVSGSRDSEVMRQLVQLVAPAQARIEQLMQRYSAQQQAGHPGGYSDHAESDGAAGAGSGKRPAGHADSLAALRGQMLGVQQQAVRQVKAVIRHNATTLAAGFATLNYLNPSEEFAFIDSLATVQANAQPASPFAQALAAKVAPLRLTKPGTTAPDISLPTPDGRQLTLKSLRGKYVLVDFWASWCGPCRRENPNVVAAYNKFKDKGFTIYSVSLDNNKERWTQAIAADNLSWPNHVSDLRGWESAGAASYGVQSIPASFLLDPQGRIMAKDLRGEDLEAKLREVLK